MRLRYLVILALRPYCSASRVVTCTFGMGQELFPPVDSGQITIYARLPSGTRIERTEDVIRAIEASIIEEIGEPDPAYAICRGPERAKTGRLIRTCSC